MEKLAVRTLTRLHDVVLMPELATDVERAVAFGTFLRCSGGPLLLAPTPPPLTLEYSSPLTLPSRPRSAVAIVH